MGADRYDYKETKESLYTITKNYKKTKLDDNFQRRGGTERNSGWTKDNSVRYVENIIDGFVSNKIMLAEVEGCLKFAKDEGDAESIKYFSNIAEEGYEYVSIDGNNSSSTINAYLNDQLSTYHSKNASLRGRGKKKLLFSELTESQQDDIKYSEKLTYYVFRKIGIIDMCALSRAENTSTKLNDQEWRQAHWSDLSKFIREKANTEDVLAIFQNLLGYGKSSDIWDKRKHEEMIAQFSLRVVNEGKQNTLKKELNTFYELTESIPTKDVKVVNAVLDIVSKMAETVLKRNATLSAADFFALLGIVQYVADDRRDIRIDDTREFLNWFLQSLHQMKEDAKKVLEEDQEDNSYTFWAARVNKHKNYNKILNAFRDKLAVSENDLLSNGTLKRTRSSKDSFNREQGISLFDLQEGKLRDGSDIDFLDVVTAGKLEVDHVTSVRDGGTTELSNGELMSVSDNRSKGGKSNPPHFKHQSDDWDGTIFIGGE